MKITQITVHNYRILRNLELDLEDDISLIVGKNNCGKTSVLSALSKFIGNGSTTIRLNYDDFNLEFQNALFESIENGGKCWESNKRKGIEVYLYIEYDENDNLANISPLILDLDPDNNSIVIKFEYTLSPEKMLSLVDSFSEYYEDFLYRKQKTSKKECFNRFLSKKHRLFFEFKKKTLLLDTVTQEPSETEYRLLDPQLVDISKILSFKYISARRDTVNADNDGTLSHLSNRYYERTKDDDSNSAIKEFEDTLVSTDISLTSIYDRIFEDVIKKIKRFGGIRQNETVIKIVSSLSQQQLLTGNTTVVYEDGNHQLPESYNGLGYLNLLNIIFEIETILSEFRCDKEVNVKPADINLLFIEEPEAHTHPQMQYVFIKNIKQLLLEGSSENADKKINLQTIITTHSSHIVADCDFDDIKYFQKSPQEGIIAKNLKDLETAYKSDKESENNRFKFLKQYLTLNCSEIFFADKVILFEGDTERILLPAMMKKIDEEEQIVDDIPILSQNVSLVEVGAHSQIFDHFLSFIGIKTLIITDIDSGIRVESDKLKKDGTKKTNIEACPVEEGSLTTNNALKHYFSFVLEEDLEIQLSHFIDRALEKRVLSKVGDTWVENSNGSLLISYQTRQTVDGNSYYPRSFEDAFLHINREFIIETKEEFVSLKNRYKLSDTCEEQKVYKYDSWDLAESCIKSKPSFAMDILLNSQSKDGQAFSNWEIPPYIKEGLLWLRKDT